MRWVLDLYIRPGPYHRALSRNPDCDWVYNDNSNVKYYEQFDGDPGLVRNGRLYRRFNLISGFPIPVGWLHHSFNPAEIDGRGWLPVRDSKSEFKSKHITPDTCYMQAFNNVNQDLEDGTYELIGRTIKGNPYNLKGHRLWNHKAGLLELQLPKDLEEWKAYFTSSDPKMGVVMKHTDGRLAKIKSNLVGVKWPVPQKC